MNLRPAVSLRRGVPYALVPLAVGACLLASSPWLRAYPAAFLALPLIGAAVLSVVVPVVVIAIGVRPLWLTALADVIAFVFFTCLAALRDPTGFAQLRDGLVHGPSQILTYALPLVSPRDLLVAPLALCWLTGAVLGECLGRGWRTLLPYATVLVTFGLSYAATTRAITDADDGRRYDTLIAAGLLLVLLLLRAGQAWLEQDASADAVGPDGVLPARSLVIGIVTAALVAGGATALARSSLLAGAPAASERQPPVARGVPITPLAFVGSLRPDDASESGPQLFDVSLGARSSRYVAIADVDTYDGDGWAFDREFRPSGGVVPADVDPLARSRGPSVTQQYRIAAGALTRSPWMPFQYRPQRITGVAVNIDATSGMVVPARGVQAGQRYTVRSATPGVAFDRLPSSAIPGTSPPPTDTFLPPSVRRSLTTVVTALRNETGTTAATPVVAFLKAVATDLRRNYALSGGPSTASPTASGDTPRAPSSSPSGANGRRAGGTGFADVLASILGPTRAATPEQYATLVALLGRQLGVPTRVVTGFRLSDGAGSTVPAGTYRVTGRQAWTWVEVPIQGRGWVVLDAAPSSFSSRRSSPSLSARPTPSESPSSTPNAALSQAPTDAGNAVAPPSETAGARNSGISTAVLVVVLIVVLALLVAGLLLLRKRDRIRRRRGDPDPRRRLVGAWQECLDLLTEAGVPELEPLTVAEVATAAAARFGPDAGRFVADVGELADAAIFHASAPVSPAAAEAAWTAHGSLRRTVLVTLTRRQRVALALRFHRSRLPAVTPVSSWEEFAHAGATSRGRTH